MGGILFTAKIDDSYILQVGGAGSGGGSTAETTDKSLRGRKTSLVAAGGDPGSGKSTDNKAGTTGRRGSQNAGAGRKSSVAGTKGVKGGAALAPGATKRIALAAMGGKGVEVHSLPFPPSLPPSLHPLYTNSVFSNLLFPLLPYLGVHQCLVDPQRCKLRQDQVECQRHILPPHYWHGPHGHGATGAARRRHRPFFCAQGAEIRDNRTQFT